jgi:hypothetical protein
MLMIKNDVLKQIARRILNGMRNEMNERRVSVNRERNE